MDLEKRLKEIREHFSTISPEEFKENMKKAGVGEINSSKLEGMELMTADRDEESYDVSSQFKGFSEEFSDFQYYNIGDAA